MTERLPPERVERALSIDPKVARLGEFLAQLRAYLAGDIVDVDLPVEGTSKTFPFILEGDEAFEMEQEAIARLTELCWGDENLAGDIRDHFLYKLRDERGLWPTDDEDK